MKITLKQLRILIREVLNQETDFPGRYRGDGEYSKEDPERLAYQGFLDLDEEDDPRANTNQ
jgi:hypothetical protein